MNKKNEKKKTIIIILLILLIINIGIAVLLLATQDHETAIIVSDSTELQDPNENNEIRIKMNTTIIVKEGTMQNLEFYNLNKGRYLQLKINTDDGYVYESPYLEEGKVIKADIVKERKLDDGKNKALAEIYSYDLNKNLIGQRNVEIVLVK